MRHAVGPGAPAVKRSDKGRERIARRLWHIAASDQLARRLDERQGFGASRRVQQLQGGGADAAARHIDDALEGEIVARLPHEAQIGECITDFLALVETRPADHAIGERERDKALLEFAGLKPGPHQNRDLGEGVPLAVQRFDLVAGPARFLLGIPETAHGDLVARAGAGPQRLAEAPAIMRDDAGGGGEDLRGRAVILFKPDDQRAREIALEFEDVADLGATPAVDRLVVVADAAEIFVLLRQEAQPQILRDIGVLVFVDQKITEAALIAGEDLGLRREQGQIVQEQVAEIDRVHGREALLIVAVERDGAAVSNIRGFARRHLIRHEAAVLPALDRAEQGPGGPTPLIKVRGGDDLFQQPELVVGVEDREIRGEADRLGMAAQDAGGDGVKCAEPDAVRGPANHRIEALAHLARRLVGEGDRQDLAREGAAGGQDMGEASRQDPRLAGPGAGQHQDRPVERLDGPALCFVERGEEARLAGR